MQKTKAQRLKLNKPATASLWYFFSTVFARGIGMLGTPIFTRLLSAEDFGVYALFLSLSTVITVPLTLELSGAICYPALQAFSDRRNTLMSGACKITLILGGGFSILFLALAPLISSLSGIGEGLVPLVPIFTLSTAIISLYTARLKYEYKYKEVTFINIILALFAPMLSIFFISVLGQRANGRIYGTLILNLLVALPLYISMQKRAPRLFDKETTSYLLKGALPLLPHYMCVSLLIRFGEIMLGRIYGATEVGKFSVASSVGLSLTMVSTSLLSALGPWLTRRVKSGDVLKIRRILDLSLKLIALCLLFVCAIAPEILRVLAPREYSDALYAIYPLALSVVPMFLSGVVTTIRSNFPRVGRSSLPSMLALLTSVLLSALLLGFDWRLLSVVVLLSYSVLALAGLYLLKRDTGFVPISGATLVSVALALAYSLILVLFRGQIVARALLLLPLIPLGVLYLKSTIKEIREKE